MLAIILLFAVVIAEYESDKEQDAYNIETDNIINYNLFFTGEETLPTVTVYEEETDVTDVYIRERDTVVTEPMRTLDPQEIADVKGKKIVLVACEDTLPAATVYEETDAKDRYTREREIQEIADVKGKEIANVACEDTLPTATVYEEETDAKDGYTRERDTAVTTPMRKFDPQVIAAVKGEEIVLVACEDTLPAATVYEETDTKDGYTREQDTVVTTPLRTLDPQEIADVKGKEISHVACEDTLPTATAYEEKTDATDGYTREQDTVVTTSMRTLDPQEIADVKDALKMLFENKVIDDVFISSIRTELARTTTLPVSWIPIANNALNEVLKELQSPSTPAATLDARKNPSVSTTQSKPSNVTPTRTESVRTTATRTEVIRTTPTRSSLVETAQSLSTSDDQEPDWHTVNLQLQPKLHLRGGAKKRRKKTRVRTRMRLSRTFTYSPTTSKTRMRKTRTRTTTTQPTPYIDIQRLIDLITNLTLDYSGNLTRKVNKTMQNVAMFTCPGWTTTTETPTTPTTTDPYGNLTGTIMGKCFVCGLSEEAMPRAAECSDAFAGDFIPLQPIDATARKRISAYRKYCRWMNIPRYMINASDSRSMWGRWTGGCSVRWIDLSGIYTQRTCRNRHRAIMGKHWASKRMAKLEMALQTVDNGCIISPAASLVPLSRGVSLYARFHVCVCTGSWCNQAPFNPLWRSFLVLLLSVFLYIL